MVMQRLAIFAAVAAYASADETCADETSMLQVAGQRELKDVVKHGDSSDRRRITAPLLHEGEQCWHADQCNRQGGSCPQYCGSTGVCCRAGVTYSDQEQEECGPNGHGIEGMHTCQHAPAQVLHEGEQCWHANQCNRQGGSCPQYCGSTGVCCRAGVTYSDQEQEDCGPNGHGIQGMHTCQLPPPATEASCLGTYEAESATIVGAIVHANTRSRGHAGFTGDSFVDYLNRNDDYIEWSVPSCSGGGATASFRYALRNGDRPLQVLVNGQEVQRRPLSFPATRSWSSWSEVSVPIELTAGSNVVRLTATGRSGANLDSLIITAT